MRSGERDPRSSQGPKKQKPKISEALGVDSFVSISARVGNDLAGYVCDADGNGLLLDVRDPSGDPEGFYFMPWSSIERVEVAR